MGTVFARYINNTSSCDPVVLRSNITYNVHVHIFILMLPLVIDITYSTVSVIIFYVKFVFYHRPTTKKLNLYDMIGKANIHCKTH